LLYRPLGLSEHELDFGVRWEGLLSLRVSYNHKTDGQNDKCGGAAELNHWGAPFAPPHYATKNVKEPTAKGRGHPKWPTASPGNEDA
jgi:hypothetical protein